MVVLWQKDAISELKDIKLFLKTYLSEEAATKTVKKVFEDCKLLASSPKMGMKLKNNPLARQMIFGKYRVIYRYDGNETIYILAVYSTAFQGYEKAINKIDIP